MKNLSLKKLLISVCSFLVFLACSKETHDPKKELIFLVQAPNFMELSSQNGSQLNEKLKSIFSKNNLDSQKSLENKVKDLEELTNVALKEKSSEELKALALKNKDFLDDNLKINFTNILDKIQDPSDFSTSLSRLSNPQNIVELSNYPKNNTKGFVYSNPGPIGWYCYSPIFGKLGPNPDFWFSAVVCAWAQGVLAVANGQGCYVFNDDPSFYCW